MLVATLFVALSIVFPSSFGASIRKRLQQPANDPFYTPPAGWESKQPGDILNSRLIAATSLGLLPTASVISYQLLYRTQDQDGTPLSTVTTIFVPALTDRKQLVSFAVAEDSGNTKCAPSYQYQFGSDNSNLLAQAELLLIQTALSQGWIVTTSDHEGPNSAFVAGRLAGRAVLDGIRATKSFSTLKLASDVKIGMWGYSGGASAIGWAAALQPSYAPELNIVGAAHGGTPANLTATAVYLNKSPSAGFVAVALYGVGAAYASAQARLNQVATPAFAMVIDYVRNHCALDVVAKYSGTDYFNGTYFTTDVLRDSVVRPILDSLILGAGETPTVPLFVYHAKNDQVIPFSNAQQMVNNYCAAGASVQFVINTDNSVGHVLEEVFTVPRTIAFLRDRFNGASTSGCSTLSVGISSGAALASEALQLGLPGLVPLLAATLSVYQALPPT